MLDIEPAVMGTLALVMFCLTAETCRGANVASRIGAHAEPRSYALSPRQARTAMGNPDTFGKPSLRW